MIQQVGNIINSELKDVNTSSANKNIDIHFNPYKRCFTPALWAIGIISLANCIILCILFPRSQELCIDYMGIIVTVLSILVTLLVGWQIYKTIGFEQKTVAELVRIENELNEKLSSNQQALHKEIEEGIEQSVNMSLFMSLAQLAFALHQSESSEEQFRNAVPLQISYNALCVWNNNTKDVEDAYNSCISLIKEYRIKDCNLVVSKDDYKLFLSAALKTQDDEIIEFTKNFKIQE